MTNLLNPALSSSKTTRKKRQQQTAIAESAATARAIATFQRAVGKQVQKADHIERQRNKAIAETMPDFISAMDEEYLAPFFFALERLATAPHRRRIASHPLRPDVVDDMHAEADEEDALSAEEEARSVAEAATPKSKTAAATPQQDADTAAPS